MSQGVSQGVSKHLTIYPPPNWPQSMEALIEAQPEIVRAIIARLQELIAEEQAEADKRRNAGAWREAGMAALRASALHSAIYAVEAVVFEHVVDASAKQRSGEGDALPSDSEK